VYPRWLAGKLTGKRGESHGNAFWKRDNHTSNGTPSACGRVPSQKPRVRFPSGLRRFSRNGVLGSLELTARARYGNTTHPSTGEYWNGPKAMHSTKPRMKVGCGQSPSTRAATLPSFGIAPIRITARRNGNGNALRLTRRSRSGEWPRSIVQTRFSTDSR